MATHSMRMIRHAVCVFTNRYIYNSVLVYNLRRRNGCDKINSCSANVTNNIKARPNHRPGTIYIFSQMMIVATIITGSVLLCNSIKAAHLFNRRRGAGIKRKT